MEDDNIAAQQAAVEAISISRSSLTTALTQEEQLNHCNNLQLRNGYIMKKYARYDYSTLNSHDKTFYIMYSQFD